MTGLPPHLIRADFITLSFVFIETKSISSFALNVQSPSLCPPKGQKPTTKLVPTKKWSMYPSLHNDVSKLLREDSLSFDFYEKDDDRSCMDSYDTNIMGRFTCHNPACQTRGWSSKQIAITIRQYSNQRYNARVYHQSCKSCETSSKPKLDHSYAEKSRISY